MDLSTTYLGFKLDSPLMPGASGMVDDLDTVRRLEDAGASAIVMHSLFEEQIAAEETATRYLDEYDDAYAQALAYFPRRTDYSLDPHHYLEHLRRIKEAVKVPVIGSLNGSTPDGWVQYATLMQQAGADAIEINIYSVITDLFAAGDRVDQQVIETAAVVKRAVTIPVAVKLSPFFSSLPNLARRLDDAGIDGLILFNRFYQPDIDLEKLQAVPSLHLSDPSELLLRLRWLAVLAGHLDASLAAGGGVHTASDALKAIAAGADAVQLVSSLLLQGPPHLRTMREGMELWLEEHEFASLGQLKGTVSLQHCTDPYAFERGSYMRILQSWHPSAVGGGSVGGGEAAR